MVANKTTGGPAGVRLKQWPSQEWNGYVCVWHHAEGQEPHWFLPVTPEIDSHEYQYGGRTESIVNCHLQEIPENAADAGHLNEVHGHSIIFGSNLASWTRSGITKFIFGSHEWRAAEWQADEQDKHVGHFRLRPNITLFGLMLISLDIIGRHVGPSLVLLKFSCPQFGVTGIMIQAVMSVACNKQRAIHQIYLDQSLRGRIFSRFMLFGEASMVSRVSY